MQVRLALGPQLPNRAISHSKCGGYEYGGTSLTKKCNALGPHRKPVRRVSEGSWGGGCFFMGEAPLYQSSAKFVGKKCNLIF